MDETSRKKTSRLPQLLYFLFFMLTGIACGYLSNDISENYRLVSGTLAPLLSMISIILLAFLALLIQTILHEAGHLLFGLLSGYHFLSFRVFSFLWMKENGKIRLKRLSLAGTDGQCLMGPPEMTEDDFPVILYNLGGSFLNMISALIFGGLALLCRPLILLSDFLLLLAWLGLGLGLLNGIPMRLNTVDNDGFNARSLVRSTEARRAFWVQLSVSEQTARGVRLRDMPEDWFAPPDDAALENSMMAATSVFTANRLMDQHRFEEADRLMAHLMEAGSGFAGIYRNLMIYDRLYCELLGEARGNVLQDLLSPAQQKFMKQMKNFPSVLRTEYAYALLAEKNGEKAAQLLAQFEKCARTYPYATDIQSERELMDIAREKTLAG